MAEDIPNKAIPLIKAGRNEEARRILEPFIESDKSNIIAWLWYAQTWATPQQRIKVLELCLEYNSGNERVESEIEKLRAEQNRGAGQRKLKAYDRKVILAVVAALSICAVCAVICGGWVFYSRIKSLPTLAEIPPHTVAAVMHEPFSSTYPKDTLSVWLLIVIDDWRNFDQDKARAIAQYYEAQYGAATSFVVIFLCDHQYANEATFTTASGQDITAHALFEYIRPKWLTSQDNPYGTACK